MGGQDEGQKEGDSLCIFPWLISHYAVVVLKVLGLEITAVMFLNVTVNYQQINYINCLQLTIIYK